MTELSLNKQNYRHVLKYQKIQTRYQHLYNVERKRMDDVFIILEDEFLLSVSRIQKILNFRLPDAETINDFVKQHKPKAVQLYLQM